jgi:hypothetical protein
MTLTEGDLVFNFEGAILALKFDTDTTRSQSSIKTVDFLIEYEDRYMFVEIKDPDAPDAANPNAFREKLVRNELIPNLAAKFRDSRFFFVHQKNIEKPIDYVVLLSIQSLDDAMLVTQLEKLHKSIPISHDSWVCNSARACVILNMRKWKEKFGANSIHRLSDQL